MAAALRQHRLRKLPLRCAQTRHFEFGALERSSPSRVFRSARRAIRAQQTVIAMAGILEDIHPALKSLWDLENELRSAAQNAIFLRNDEAKKHMDEARRHYQEALKAIREDVGSKTSQSQEDATPPKSDLPPSAS